MAIALTAGLCVAACSASEAGDETGSERGGAAKATTTDAGQQVLAEAQRETEARFASSGRISIRDSAGIRIVESTGTVAELANRPSPFLLGSEPELSIGEETGEEPYLLHRVSDAERLTDGRILVGNSGSQEIRVFSETGEHRMNVGRRGGGPGEFGGSSPIRMVRSGDTLLAQDHERHRVHVFAPNLEFIETRPLQDAPGVTRPSLRGAFADGTWLTIATEGGGALNGRPGQIIRLRHNLLRYSPNGELMNSLVTLDAPPRIVNAPAGGGVHFPYLPLTSRQVATTRGDSLVVLRGTTPELEFYDQAGTLVQLIRWPRERIRSADVYPEFRERELRTLETELNQQIRIQYTALYQQELPLPEYAPLYADIRIDDAQRIWVERARLDNAESRMWDVIDTDGAWLGTVTLPPRWALYRAGTDYVLGRALDAFGVARVQLFRVQQAMP